MKERFELRRDTGLMEEMRDVLERMQMREDWKGRPFARKGVNEALKKANTCSEHVLDCFHITMKITVLDQFVKGLAHLDALAAAQLEEDLARIKWKLWHGIR